MKTKSGKDWSFPVRVKYNTVMGNFVERFAEKLAFARKHMIYGFHQQQAHKNHHSDGWTVSFLHIVVHVYYIKSNLKIFRTL